MILVFRADDFHVGNKVADEVRKIMGPRQYVSYSPITNSASSSRGTDFRKHKGKGKYQLAVEKCGGSKKKNRSSAVTFQKKLYVFNYRGPDAPDTFTRSDKDIITRGLLPQISVSATEKEVRSEIFEIMQSCETPNLSEIGPDDFQFINMSGKQASVPYCKRKGFEWNGRAVKELAGSGAVYIRLTKPPGILSISDDEDLVPYILSPISATPMPVASSKLSPNPVENVSITSVDSSDVLIPAPSLTLSSTPATSSNLPITLVDSSDVVGVSGDDPGPAVVSLLNVSSTSPIIIDDRDQVNSLGDSPTSMLHQVTGCEVDNISDTTKLEEMFPNMTNKQLMYVYNLSGSSFSKAVECLLEGPSLESICSLVTSQMSLDTSPRIRLDKDDDDEDWTEAALAFYKQGKFDKSSGLRICIRGQPAIDAGGVRRQFFAVVFSQLARTDAGFSLFEGFPLRLRPVFKASVLSSGMLATLGTMIAHSILLDSQGFPYLAEYCYYYIAGCYDQAVTCVSIDDIGANVQYVLDKVQLLHTEIMIIVICVLYL